MANFDLPPEGRAFWYSYGECGIVPNSFQVDGTIRPKPRCHQNMRLIAMKKKSFGKI